MVILFLWRLHIPSGCLPRRIKSRTYIRKEARLARLVPAKSHIEHGARLVIACKAD